MTGELGKAIAAMTMVKADAEPFVANPHDLDIWTNDYFLQVAQMLQFE